MVLNELRRHLRRQGFELCPPPAPPGGAGAERAPDVYAESEEPVAAWIMDEATAARVIQGHVAARSLPARAIIVGHRFTAEARRWADRYGVELMDAANLQPSEATEAAAPHATDSPMKDTVPDGATLLRDAASAAAAIAPLGWSNGDSTTTPDAAPPAVANGITAAWEPSADPAPFLDGFLEAAVPVHYTPGESRGENGSRNGGAEGGNDDFAAHVAAIDWALQSDPPGASPNGAPDDWQPEARDDAAHEVPLTAPAAAPSGPARSPGMGPEDAPNPPPVAPSPPPVTDHSASPGAGDSAPASAGNDASWTDRNGDVDDGTDAEILGASPRPRTAAAPTPTPAPGMTPEPAPEPAPAPRDTPAAPSAAASPLGGGGSVLATTAEAAAQASAAEKNAAKDRRSTTVHADDDVELTVRGGSEGRDDEPAEPTAPAEGADGPSSSGAAPDAPLPPDAASGDGPARDGDEAAMRRHDPALWNTSGRLNAVRSTLRGAGESGLSLARDARVQSPWLRGLSQHG